MLKLLFKSEDELTAFAVKLGGLMRGGEVIGLSGELGVGKTVFTRGLASGMGITGAIKSPSFALIREHPNPGGIPLYHFDVYRISDPEELLELGFYDYMSLGGVLAIEWCPNIAELMPENTTYVTIERTQNELERCVTFCGTPEIEKELMN